MRVVTGEVRLSFAHLFQPHAINPGDEPKYQVMLLIPKKDSKTLQKLREAEAAAKANKWPGKAPKTKPSVIHDGDVEGDTEKYPELAGNYYLNVASNRKPGIIDADNQEILDPTEVYSGCYAKVSLTAYAYDNNFGKGVGFGLNNVKKTRDGEALSGSGIKAEDEDWDDDDLL